MSRISKIYRDKEELSSIAPSAKLLETYDAFQLVAISPTKLKEAAKKVPVEDITSQYRLQMAGKLVNTKIPQYSTNGKPLSQSGDAETPKLVAGKHHYLVKFRGPVKDSWIRQVKKAGGDCR